ncbi:MFS transporter [Streptomyces albulus]|nr:MFS transporter [Streptomyces noursei]
MGGRTGCTPRRTPQRSAVPWDRREERLHEHNRRCPGELRPGAEHQRPGADPGPGPARPSSPWKIATASLIGTSVEWYDFGIYATASALVFPELFFPEMNRALGTLMSFATLFVGALGRPLGAIVFGHIGDRYGRKKALIWSLTLMGAGTVGIGLLPGYHAIGVVAPVLLVLVRMTQSLAVGGEWGGAVLFAVEHAPPRRKAFFGSFPQVGDGVGYFLSTGAFAAVGLLGHRALLDWAWRVPFLPPPCWSWSAC